MIAQKTVQEIFETAKIEEVVEEFVNLKRRGSNMIGLCPFHNEKTPSFSVSPSKNIFKCFGCGRGGNAVQFLMEHESFTFPESLRYLAAKYNIEIEENIPTDEERVAQLEEESYYIINQFANDFFQKQLFETDSGRTVGLSYFKERGYLESTIKKFDLGFSPAQKDVFTRHAIAKKYKVESLKKLGLTTRYDTDFFKNRVIFPIHGLTGKPIAFAGRALTISDKRTPKYINSPESPIYHKSQVLYGLYFARQAIRRLDNCFMVEGYTDVISLHQFGIENVVASSGTSLTQGQIKSVKRYTPNITVLYDGDPAGVKAALRGLDLILEEGMNVRLVMLPADQDPDSYVREIGVSAFETFLKENAKDFILFKTELLSADAGNDPIQRSLLIKDVVNSIAKIPDPIKRSIYIQECGQLLNMEEAILVREVNKFIRENLKQKSRERGSYSRVETDLQTIQESADSETQKEQSQGQLIEVRSPDEFQERDLIRILICHGHKPINTEENAPSLAEYIFQNIADIRGDFDNEVFRKILDLYETGFDEGGVISHHDLVQMDDLEIRNLTIQMLTTPYEYSNWDDNDYPLQTQIHPEDNFIKDSYSAIMRLKLHKIIRQIKENQEEIEKLTKAGDQENQITIKVKMHFELIRMRNEITSEFKNVII